MLADDLLLLSTSAIGAENKLGLLSQYLSDHAMSLNAKKSWVMNLTLDRGLDPDVWCLDAKVPMVGKEMYNGWKLAALPKGPGWQSSAHMEYRYANSLRVAQSLMSLTKSMNVPTSSLSTGLYRSLVEPELIYACESSFDCSSSLNVQYDRLQLKFLRFCLGLPSNSVSDLVLWDCGQLALSSRRLQLASRFFAYVACLDASRISHHALRDSLALHVGSGKGWFSALVKKTHGLVAMPALEDLDGCLEFPSLLQVALKDRQWRRLVKVVSTSSVLRSLTWAPPSRTLKKAAYLKLPRYLARAIARLRFGCNNLAVHRLAWEKVAWEDRRCVCCNEVETETHVLAQCGVFDPERFNFLEELVEIHEDCKSWDKDRFMRIILGSKTAAEARIVGFFLREIWRQVNERYIA